MKLTEYLLEQSSKLGPPSNFNVMAAIRAWGDIYVKESLKYTPLDDLFRKAVESELETSDVKKANALLRLCSRGEHYDSILLPALLGIREGEITCDNAHSVVSFYRVLFRAVAVHIKFNNKASDYAILSSWRTTLKKYISIQAPKLLGCIDVQNKSVRENEEILEYVMQTIVESAAYARLKPGEFFAWRYDNSTRLVTQCIECYIQLYDWKYGNKYPALYYTFGPENYLNDLMCSLKCYVNYTDFENLAKFFVTKLRCTKDETQRKTWKLSMSFLVELDEFKAYKRNSKNKKYLKLITYLYLRGCLPDSRIPEGSDPLFQLIKVDSPGSSIRQKMLLRGIYNKAARLGTTADYIWIYMLNGFMDARIFTESVSKNLKYFCEVLNHLEPWLYKALAAGNKCKLLTSAWNFLYAALTKVSSAEILENKDLICRVLPCAFKKVRTMETVLDIQSTMLTCIKPHPSKLLTEIYEQVLESLPDFSIEKELDTLLIWVEKYMTTEEFLRSNLLDIHTILDILPVSQEKVSYYKEMFRNKITLNRMKAHPCDNAWDHMLYAKLYTRKLLDLELYFSSIETAFDMIAKESLVLRPIQETLARSNTLQKQQELIAVKTTLFNAKKNFLLRYKSAQQKDTPITDCCPTEIVRLIEDVNDPILTHNLLRSFSEEIKVLINENKNICKLKIVF